MDHYQNLDLAPEFLFRLEQRLDEIELEDIHEDFRVWFTWSASPQKLPHLPLLQRALLVYCQPSREIRFHLDCSYYGSCVVPSSNTEGNYLHFKVMTIFFIIIDC